MDKLPLSERRAISVNEFCQFYGVSRGTTYTLLNTGVLKSAIIRKRRMVLVESAKALLKSGKTEDEFLLPQSIYSFRRLKGRSVNSRRRPGISTRWHRSTMHCAI